MNIREAYAALLRPALKPLASTWGRLFGKWLAARWQWVWCAVYGHPLTIPQKVRCNNRHGQEAFRDEWCECACGSRKGPTTRVRIMRPYQESL